MRKCLSSFKNQLISLGFEGETVAAALVGVVGVNAHALEFFLLHTLLDIAGGES